MNQSSGRGRRGGEQTQSEVGKWSARDAQRLPDYYAMLDRVVHVLRELMVRTPPSKGVGWTAAATVHPPMSRTGAATDETRVHHGTRRISRPYAEPIQPPAPPG